MKTIIALGIFLCYSTSQAFDCCNYQKPEYIERGYEKLFAIQKDFTEFINSIDERICDDYSNTTKFLQDNLMDFYRKHTKEQCICGRNSGSNICECIQKINDKAAEKYKDHIKNVTSYRNRYVNDLNNEATNRINLIRNIEDYFNNHFFICQCLLSGTQSSKCYEETLSRIESVEDLEKDINQLKHYFRFDWIGENIFRETKNSFVDSLKALESSFDNCTEQPIYPQTEASDSVTLPPERRQPTIPCPTCPAYCQTCCPAHCPTNCPKDCDNKHDSSGCQFCIKLQL